MVCWLSMEGLIEWSRSTPRRGCCSVRGPAAKVARCPEARFVLEMVFRGSIQRVPTSRRRSAARGLRPPPGADGVFLAKPHQTETATVADLWMRLGGQDLTEQFGGMRARGAGPVEQPRGSPFQTSRLTNQACSRGLGAVPAFLTS